MQQTRSKADQFLDDVMPGTYQVVTPRPIPTFREFKEKLFKRYVHPRHNDIVDEALMMALLYVETQGAEGWGHIVLVEPPRHGKTLNLARLFPAYVLGKHPEWRVIESSYQQELIRKSSRAVRNFINSPVYREMFPGVYLSGDSYSASSWDLAGTGGGMDAVGVGSGVTGKGGHLLIGDDLLSGRKDAESEVKRNTAWEWFTDDFYTRGDVDYAAFILSNTRWHLDDPIGRALKNMPGKWKEIVLPAIAVDKDSRGRKVIDLMGRKPGEPLWGERWGLPRLKEIQKTQGDYGFNALFQGDPVPAEGGLFKRKYFKIVPAHPPVQAAVRFWDLAMSDRTSADYTAGLKYLLCNDGHRYIADLAHDQIEWGELAEWMAQVIMSDGPTVQQFIESKGFMTRAITTLNLDDRLHGYQIFGYDVDTNKFTRALPAVAKASAGVVHLIEGHWNETFLDEVCSFPFGAKDDIVDAFSGAEAALGDIMTDATGGLYVDESGAISTGDF